MNWSLLGQLVTGWIILSIVTALSLHRLLCWMDKRARLRRLHELLVACDTADIERDALLAQAITDRQYRIWRESILRQVVEDNAACAFELDEPFQPQREA